MQNASRIKRFRNCGSVLHYWNYYQREKVKPKKQVYDITLECLRTNVPIPPDNFQDYDLTFLVMDVQGFIVKNASSDVFNKKLIL